MFPYTDPKTAQDALRQCRIAERAKQVAEALRTGSDYYSYHCGNGVYGVAKRSHSEKPDTVYTVTLTPVSCTCQDFQNRGDYCKHTVALWETLEEEAQCEQAEEEADARAVMEASAIDGELRGSYGVAF